MLHRNKYAVFVVVAEKCRQLTAPLAGGFIAVNGFVVNSSANFHCLNGYKLIGNQQITCLNSKKWSNDEPICQGLIL